MIINHFFILTLFIAAIATPKNNGRGDNRARGGNQVKDFNLIATPTIYSRGRSGRGDNRSNALNNSRMQDEPGSSEGES